MKKRKKKRFKCKQFPKIFKDKLTLNMHKKTLHQENYVETRNSLTPTSGTFSLDTPPAESQGIRKK